MEGLDLQEAQEAAAIELTDSGEPDSVSKAHRVTESPNGIIPLELKLAVANTIRSLHILCTDPKDTSEVSILNLVAKGKLLIHSWLKSVVINGVEFLESTFAIYSAFYRVL